MRPAAFFVATAVLMAAATAGISIANRLAAERYIERLEDEMSALKAGCAKAHTAQKIMLDAAALAGRRYAEKTRAIYLDHTDDDWLAAPLPDALRQKYSPSCDTDTPSGVFGTMPEASAPTHGL